MLFINDISIILTASIVTFLIRLSPFILFGRKEEPPSIIKFLGETLPASVIAILILYCLKEVNIYEIQSVFPQFIAIAIVAALHIWKRNILLSISLGTISYMIMVQFIF